MTNIVEFRPKLKGTQENQKVKAERVSLTEESEILELILKFQKFLQSTQLNPSEVGKSITTYKSKDIQTLMLMLENNEANWGKYPEVFYGLYQIILNQKSESKNVL